MTQQFAINPRYIYNMRHRPLDFNTAPAGWTDYLPLASRWGWIVYDRELSPEEVYEYELELVHRCPGIEQSGQ